MLKLIRENKRARIQLFVRVARHGKPGVHDAYVSALNVLDDDIQTIEARTEGHSFLINRLQLKRLLEQGIRKILRHRIFESLNDAASQGADAHKNVHGGRMDAILRLKVELAVGHLDGDGNQHGVIGYLHEIRAPSELELIADDSRGHNPIYPWLILLQPLNLERQIIWVHFL